MSGPVPSPSASPTHLINKQTLRSTLYIHGYVRFSPRPPLAGAQVGGGWGGGLALEAQLLVLGSDVVPEQLQGLLHGSLGVRTEVPGVLALKNLDDGV